MARTERRTHETTREKLDWLEELRDQSEHHGSERAVARHKEAGKLLAGITNGVSRGPGGSLEEAKALRHDKANDEQRDQHPPSPSHACTSPPLPYMQRLNTAETSAVTPFPQLERARP